MPIVDYPFQIQGKFRRPAPILPLKVVNPDNHFEYLTWGLIDTGATASIIPDYIAIELGHRLTEGKLCPAFTGSGDAVVYEHTGHIEVLEVKADGSVNEDTVIITIPHKGKHIGVLEGCPFVLLGVNDFLTKYVLWIDYTKQIFSVRHPKPRRR